MAQNYTLLVNSSDGFEDCWGPFFTLLTKYWPSFDAPIVLNTEKKHWSFPGLNIHCSQVQRPSEERLPWSKCLIRALDQVQTPLVLYFQEDYFLHQPVRADIVQAAANYMAAHPEIEHIALTKHGSHGPFEAHDENWLQTIRQNARYRISTQAALWRVDALKSYIRSEENGWMFEIFGTWRAHKKKAIFLNAKFDEAHGGPAIDYLHTGIIKDKWLKTIQLEFEANSIQVDYNKRGFYAPKHPLLHKFDVARKLLESPRLLLAAISINKIFASSFFVSILMLLCSILGFGVQLLIARRFGTSAYVDAYFFSLSLPIFIAGMISIALSYNVIPHLVSLENQPASQKRYLISAFLGINLIAVGLVSSGMTIAWLQIKTLPDLSPIRQCNDLTTLIALGWFIGAFQIIQAYLIAAVNAMRKHIQAATLSLLPYLGMGLLLLFWGNTGHIAVVSLGMLLGTVIAALIALWILRHHFFPLKNIEWAWDDFKHLLFGIPYTVVATSCFATYLVVDAYWAPRAGTGALAALAYSQRLLTGLGSLAVTGPAAVLVPRFSELIRDKNFREFRRFLIYSVVIVGGIITTFGLLLMLFANPIIKLMFVRGAFSLQDAETVANTLRHMAPGMIAMVIAVIAMRALLCINGTAKVAAVIGITWGILYFSISALFCKSGSAGLATAYSTAWIIMLLVIAITIFKKTEAC